MSDDENEVTKTEVVTESDGNTETTPATKVQDGSTTKAKPAAKSTSKKRTTKPKDERVELQLEENDDIPPNGLFIGLNGRGYLLRPGEKVKVPLGIVEILENAITSVPVTDPATKQVIGYRDRLKYPFRKF